MPSGVLLNNIKLGLSLKEIDSGADPSLAYGHDDVMTKRRLLLLVLLTLDKVRCYRWKCCNPTPGLP